MQDLSSLTRDGAELLAVEAQCLNSGLPGKSLLLRLNSSSEKFCSQASHESV